MDIPVPQEPADLVRELDAKYETAASFPQRPSPGAATPGSGATD